VCFVAGGRGSREGIGHAIDRLGVVPATGSRARGCRGGGQSSCLRLPLSLTCWIAGAAGPQGSALQGQGRGGGQTAAAAG
jgi:hypothetical protein